MLLNPPLFGDDAAVSRDLKESQPNSPPRTPLTYVCSGFSRHPPHCSASRQFFFDDQVPPVSTPYSRFCSTKYLSRASKPQPSAVTGGYSSITWTTGVHQIHLAKRPSSRSPSAGAQTVYSTCSSITVIIWPYLTQTLNLVLILLKKSILDLRHTLQLL